MATLININYRDSLAALIAHAEILKNRKEYLKAKEIYMKASEENFADSFLIQRLALLTFKTGLPDKLSALEEAQRILVELKPEESTDAETLGLSGSINKKLYEESGDEIFLQKALEFYKRGFYIARDYYNGINLVYIYILKAVKEENKHNAFSYFGNATLINKSVIEMCKALIAAPDFAERHDKEFIYETLAQAHLGLDQNHEVIKLIPTINEQSRGGFDLDIFHEQNFKLIDLITKFKNKYPDFV